MSNKVHLEKENETVEVFKKILTYSLAVCFIIALGVLLFAGLGAAVFFLPLLAGAFNKS